MPFVYSPSNMQTFRDCPLRFWGQSISKEIKWFQVPWTDHPYRHPAQAPLRLE